jgi:hypothetical protein
VGMAKAELVTRAAAHGRRTGKYKEINFTKVCPMCSKYLSRLPRRAMSGYVANPRLFAALPAEYQKVIVEVFMISLKITQAIHNRRTNMLRSWLTRGCSIMFVSEENLANSVRSYAGGLAAVESKMADQLAIIKNCSKLVQIENIFYKNLAVCCTVGNARFFIQ